MFRPLVRAASEFAAVVICLMDNLNIIAVSLVIWPRAKTNARLTYKRKDVRAKTTKISMKIIAESRRPLPKMLIARKIITKSSVQRKVSKNAENYSNFGCVE